MSLPRTLYCGPSGWSYPHWNGIVYPRLKPRSFHALEHLSTYFDSVEINTSFYQSIQPELASLWVRKVAHNPKFLFTVKLGRRFTHERSLGPRRSRTSKKAFGRCSERGNWAVCSCSFLGVIVIPKRTALFSLRCDGHFTSSSWWPRCGTPVGCMKKRSERSSTIASDS